MTTEVTETTDFQIINFDLKTKDGSLLSLKGLFQEISLYDSIFSPCLMGKVLITDGIGLINKLQFDGSEALYLKIGKTADDITFQQAYRIHKLSDRKSINQTSEVYVLHFVSDEFVLSPQLKVNQVYTNFTYSNMVVHILNQYLGVDKMIIHETEGIHNKQMPNMSPLDTVNWIATRALDTKGSPSFIFFQNRYGFNFVSLNELISSKSYLNINFNPKNLAENDDFNSEFYGARDVKVLNQYNLVDNIKSGVYASSLVGFDPITRKVTTKNLSFYNHYGKNAHLNDNKNLAEFQNQPHASRSMMTNTQNFKSRKLLYPVGYDRVNSQYIKENDRNSLNTVENPDYLLERKAVLKNLLTKRVRVVMPGNFNFTTGQNVVLNYPEKQNQTSDNKDGSIYGKYIIIGARHIITYNKHETIFDAASDSNTIDRYQNNNTTSAQFLDEYGI